MLHVTNCPNCERLLSVPECLDSARTIACPLCGNAFDRGDVNMRSVPEAVLADAARGANAAESPDGVPSLELVNPVETTDAVHGAFDDAIRAVRNSPARRRQASFLRQLIGVFAGGVLGLAIGYYILLWVGGADRDFLGIGDTLPPWLAPQSFRSD